MSLYLVKSIKKPRVRVTALLRSLTWFVQDEYVAYVAFAASRSIWIFRGKGLHLWL